MYTVRVTNIAVNIEQIIPALNVTANPLMGPEPIHANTNAAIKVVILASIIAWFLFQEVIGFYTLIGGIITLVGLFLLAQQK